MTTGVEFVTTAPPEVATEETAAPERSQWTREELDLVLQGASGHIRFLLHELAQAEAVAAHTLESKPVAYAQVQRICNSRGKEGLVVSSERGGEKWYSLDPKYRSMVAEIVADAQRPPPTEPKPPREPGMPRRRRGMKNMSALDGIADVRGTSLAPAAAPTRRIAQTQAGRSLAIPADVSIDFCKELLGFVNATGGGTRYRIVLEDDGYRLEAC